MTDASDDVAADGRDEEPAIVDSPAPEDAMPEIEQRDADSPLSIADAETIDASAPLPETGPPPPPSTPVSKYCGDAIRDPVLEECDDGPGTADDTCSPDCRVRSAPLLGADAGADSGTTQTLGDGVHVAAGFANGFGVVYLERTNERTRVKMQAFGEAGGRRGPALELGEGAMPLGEAHPVIAALPDERYAVAWTDGRAGTPDIQLTLISTAAGEARQGEPIAPHASSSGFQQDVDVLWTGSELIVAWTDLLDVKYRRFDASLRPLEGERALGDTSAIESSVALAAFGDAWAAAMRVNEEGLERIRVRAGARSWITQPEPLGPRGDRPALVALDDQHLLLLYTIGTDPLGSGSATLGRLRASVLSASAPGSVNSVPWLPLSAPDAPGVAQQRPSAMRVGERIYVAWQSASMDEPAPGVRAFLSEVEFDAETGELIQHDERTLPLAAAPSGSQANPRLGASALFPEGALITVWEDANAPVLQLDFRPSPFVTLPASMQ